MMRGESMNNDKQSESDKVIFAVTIKDLQKEAINRIGRKLNNDEVYTAQKGIQAGLSFDIDTVIGAAIKGAVRNKGS